MWQCKIGRTMILVFIVIVIMNILSFYLGRVTADSKIDINHATCSELDSLSGIGYVKANKIIENRPYKDIYDLVSLKIIGETTFKNIKKEISVDD